MKYNSLMEAQMGEWPDSLVLTDRQMHDAMRVAVPDWLANHKIENWKHLQIEQTRAQWARSAFYYRSGDPAGFFYACGKQDDGTYRHVGFRYGTEDCEYASGFDGMTYTPTKGDNK
jgi:hypothetical protein